MIKTDITVPVGYTADDVERALVHALPIESCELSRIEILKKALKITDSGAEYRLTVGAELPSEREAGLLKMKKRVAPYPDLSLSLPASKLNARPIIVGAGPAGLAAALALAEAGARPIVLERGLPVDKRQKSVDTFLSGRELDAECNIQFGEGGAGAFSDGKLKVGAMDKYKRWVLESFVSAGAPEDILYTVGAHLGTDKLPLIVKRIRERALCLGAEFYFSARLTDISVKDGAVCGAGFEREGRAEFLPTDRLILAAGHSACDVFELLLSKGVPMQSRGFGMGMRIEHPREYINKLVYGNESLADSVGTASYHLVTHLENGRSVYSFCMCPGGEVVPAASERGGIVTNGMSPYSRMEANSNSALLVSLTPEDFGSDSVLAGVYFQRAVERRAYALTQSYLAPAITLADFTAKACPMSIGAVKPSYRIGTHLASPEQYLPQYVTESLRAGIADFDKWLSGFALPDAVLTGPETRSTSPVRVLRSDESYQSLSLKGLYPVGEGAGYAGGIVSSATDGVRCAEKILYEE